MLAGELYARLCRTSDMLVAYTALVGTFLASNLDRMPRGFGDFLSARITVQKVLLLFLFALLWRGVSTLVGLYNWQRIRSRSDEIPRVMLVTTLATIGALVFPASSSTGAFEYVTLVYFWAASSAGMIVMRSVMRMLSEVPYARGVRDTIIVGTGPRALDLYRELSAPGAGYNVLGFVDSSQEPPAPEVSQRLLGSLDQLEGILVGCAVEEVVIALPIKSHYGAAQQVIEVCERVGVPTRHLADVFRTSRPNPWPRPLDQLLVSTDPRSPDHFGLLVKRVIDVSGAVLGLLLLSPVMCAAAIAIKLSSRGPVMFGQTRYGLQRRPFKMYKFRTMVANAEALQPSLEYLNEASGPMFKLHNDPRVTRVGRFFRRMSIDELPQLVNVLRGEMSLVGPRPLPPRDVSRFTEAALLRRFSVRPGLSGLWQISGRSDVEYNRWIILDLQYIDEWSLALDLRILIRTLPVVFRGIGAS